jgi:NAD(P)-dependent dehydrogenase (short-subunit alcohol dehydrogenase family)
MTPPLRVIVTAGAAGIGRVVAEAFAAEGARVHACDVDNEAVASAAGRPGIVASLADVIDEAAIESWLERALADLGGVDVLVNNAGIAGPVGPVETLTLADWRKCLAVNVDAQMLACRRVVPAMKAERSGCIINLSSTSGLYGVPNRTAYAAAKWAVVGFTKSLAIEVGPWNIRVNAICPGAVEGARMDRVIAAEAQASGRSEEAVRRDYTQGVSLRRFVRPEEIAQMCLFLASPAAAMVSGQAIAVDGNTETYHSE